MINVKTLRDFGAARDDDNICHHAADEIERLRAALTEISQIENEQYGPDWAEIERARDIAVRALSPNEQSVTKDG